MQNHREDTVAFRKLIKKMKKIIISSLEQYPVYYWVHTIKKRKQYNLHKYNLKEWLSPCIFFILKQEPYYKHLITVLR